MPQGSVSLDWAGQTGFVVAGGPSVLDQPYQRLAGRAVIAVNSAIKTVPFAPCLFFGDRRWWADTATGTKFGVRHADQYEGAIYTASPGVPDDRVTILHKIKPPNIALQKTHVTMQWTSVTGAINVMFHAGVRRVVLLGVDGAVNGRRHNHDDKYPWPLKADSFARHENEFRLCAPALRGAGMEILNATPCRQFKFWPSVRLEDYL